MSEELLNFTSEIVAAHVSNNEVGAEEVASLIASVYSALEATTKQIEDHTLAKEPAVPVRSSIKPDYLVCLEDGASLKMLKRYLRTRYNLSPEEYRTKWNLPPDYPMVAPSYAEARRVLAKKFGLGLRAAEEILAEPAAVAPTEKRGRVRPKKLALTASLVDTRQGG